MAATCTAGFKEYCFSDPRTSDLASRPIHAPVEAVRLGVRAFASGFTPPQAKGCGYRSDSLCRIMD
jgi:hypothetical protein